MSEEEEKQGFVVRDKRRFDEDGKPRSAESGAEGASDDSAVDSKAVESSEKDAGFVMSDAEERPVQPPPDFSAFMLSLATQTLVQLGEMPPPEGMNIPVNVIAAKQTIDILTMLSEKTQGNRTETEDKLIQEILHNLRMSYVRVSGS